MLNLANLEVHGTHLPEDLFSCFWCEHSNHIRDDETPTLERLFQLDFNHAILSLPYLGPFNDDKVFLTTCIFKTALKMINDTPELKALVDQLEEGDYLELLSHGKLEQVATHSSRLLQRIEDLAFTRHQLEVKEEPTFEDKLMLESIARQRRTLLGLKDLAFYSGSLLSSYTHWRDFYIALQSLKVAALAPWKRGDLKPTDKHYAEWNLGITRHFLTAYAEPRYVWQ